MFFRKKLIGKTDYFKGFTDCHCHILPGVDDGFKTIEDSLAILKRYEELGIASVWLTPHMMEDLANTTQSLQERFFELKNAYKGNLALHLAAEYMLDGGFEEHLENKDILAFVDDDQVLVETSYFNPPTDLMNILQRIKSKGYYPVLAHPERYMYMDERMYKEIKSMDVRFQLNLGSLSGAYGRYVKKKALSMLKKQWYSYMGTDLHSESMFEMILEAEVPKQKL